MAGTCSGPREACPLAPLHSSALHCRECLLSLPGQDGRLGSRNGTAGIPFPTCPMTME